MDIGKSQHQSVRFTPKELRLIRRLRSPQDVQRFINRLPYNTEPNGDTLRGFRGVVKKGKAHCLEAALFAACVMEQHGYPPLLMGLPGDNTYGNYAEANRAFWRQTIIPLVKRTAASLAHWLSPAFGAELTLEPDLDAVEALADERESL